ncbi:AAA family ATPase [Fusarium austroafricanum]|uniref:AAA family ATPase n=1 Tax=Fusarium austroafricanum TaxID=2364996 RepID=A0A8H4KMZ5_9HYPO|nr:AAA family ATPase [Fusarium austroafricanum]
MLQKLPQELLDIIIGQISFDDVKSLSLVSKQLHSATLQIIWRSVFVYVDLRFTTKRGSRGCPHSRRLQASLDFEESDESIADEQAPFGRFMERLRHLQWRGLNTDNLEALSSALENNKGHLETLEINLVHWKSLRQALGYENDNQRVNEMRARDYIEKVVFGLNKYSPGLVFPSMHTLVLERVALTGTLAHSLDFKVLRSLTIRLCPQWYDFIKAINQLKIHPKLKRLEIQEAWPRPEGISVLEHDPILLLLESIEGLEELYIGQSGEGYSRTPWEYAEWSGSTLKRYVNHTRLWEESIGWTDASNSWYGYDHVEEYKLDHLEFIGLSCEQFDLEWVFPPYETKDCLKVVHVRQSTRFEDDGYSWAIRRQHVITTARTIPIDGPVDLPRDCLVPQFYRFVQWAFGEEGIQSLQYILYGDFSRGESCDRTNLLFCRDDIDEDRVQDFRIIRETAAGPEWDYVKREYGSAMSCCPLDPLFEVPNR